MCYLPLPCLKAFVGLGAMVSILISLGMLAITVYVNVEKKQILNHTASETINTALVVLYLASAVFMVLGICGLYGAIQARKKSKRSGNCLLFFYFIGIMVFFFLFIAGAVLFFIGPETIFGNSCQHGAKTDLVEKMSILNTEASQQFCTTDCPCYISNKNIGSYLDVWLSENGKVTTNTEESKLNYQACLNGEEAESSNVLLMTALEEMLECSSWCDTEKEGKYLKFSDINSCVDEKCLEKRMPCYQEFEKFLTGEGRLVGIGCAVATLICFLNIITVCCICYHPSKSKKGDNFYKRMHGDD